MISSAKLYVQKTPWSNEHSFVSLQHQALYIKTNVRFTVAGDITLPQSHWCATLNIFIYLTVTYSSTTNIECTVVFPLQQWLRGRAPMLSYIYLDYAVNNSLFCTDSTCNNQKPNSDRQMQKLSPSAGSNRRALRDP